MKPNPTPQPFALSTPRPVLAEVVGRVPEEFAISPIARRVDYHGPKADPRRFVSYRAATSTGSDKKNPFRANGKSKGARIHNRKSYADATPIEMRIVGDKIEWDNDKGPPSIALLKSDTRTVTGLFRRPGTKGYRSRVAALECSACGDVCRVLLATWAEYAYPCPCQSQGGAPAMVGSDPSALTKPLPRGVR